ncbi:ATP-binding protein [Streptomyces sp. BF23-18]|uniref:ATP-binding protein n=1 Tax=Streptomyces sp. BF23-18 TaxID=3240282 RepID=UPI0034E3ADAF
MPAISDGGDWGLLLGISAAEFSVHRFTADSTGLYQARLFARNVLEEWGLSSCVDDAVIVVGELIANAATHALEPETREGATATAWLGLVRRQQAVICAVADPSSCAPQPQRPEPLSESGRGLRIVEAISSSWGYSPPRRSGKMVWARVLAAPDT